MQNSWLSCDSNLVPLVCFLFGAGWFLFSSLKTGINTTRVVVRMARDGCSTQRVQGGKRVVSSGVKITQFQATNPSSGYLLNTTVSYAYTWLKSFGTLSSGTVGSRIGTLPSKVRGIPSKVRSIPSRISSRAATLRRRQRSHSQSMKKWSQTRISLVTHAVPYRWLTTLMGYIVAIPLPFGFLRHLVYMGWTKAYNCLLHEMEHDSFDAYPTLSAFFLRGLKPGVRKIDCHTPGTVVSPVDGKILHVGSADLNDLSNVVLEQVKGVTYGLQEFIGACPDGFDCEKFKQAMKDKLDEAAANASGAPNRKLQTVVLYLAPGDYHHFHSPADWTITQRRHFPGNLLPVRPWAVEQIKSLYCINERVVLNGTWEQGYFGYVAVGALNVGSIEIAFDKEVKTNQSATLPFQMPKEDCIEKNYEQAIPAVRGQRLGHFNLGSTIVMVFETTSDFKMDCQPGQVVRVGETLGCEDITLKNPEQLPVACPPWPSA